MDLCVLHHTIDFVIGKCGRSRNGDLLLLARAQVLSGNVHDAVRIDVERNLDLRHATTCGRDTSELELAECLVTSCHFALALQDMDLNAGLIISRRRIDLSLAGRDGGVALDHLGHDAAHGLNTE
ncbi:uncharacterized protein BN592_00070 [Eggerthella sp. CAG:298]|nr:uncharacterized protein BN592_00070 [Eggerthella sp. CAG:298]